MKRTPKHVHERIQYLYAVAKRWSTEKRYADARTAIKQLRLVAMKHTLTITDLKKTFCKTCNTLLIPGATCTVRVHNNRRVITCQHCQSIKRLGIT